MGLSTSTKRRKPGIDGYAAALTKLTQHAYRHKTLEVCSLLAQFTTAVVGESNDAPLIVDARGFRAQPVARGIDRGVAGGGSQEAVPTKRGATRAFVVGADDIAVVVDVQCYGVERAWWRDCGEASSVQLPGVELAVGVDGVPHDLVAVVDRAEAGHGGA
ncbi:MAG: hypothetical protein J2P37_35705, partial [Ktedonobacteraceae bacterium]|nr:hypothetical protein [Ktedonobacteraceae bacterium]